MTTSQANPAPATTDRPWRRSRAAVLGWLMVVALVAAGCAAQPDPRAAAEALAADLEDGTFDSAAISSGDEAGAALAALLGDLADTPRTVEAGEVTESEAGSDAREVELTWTWDLAGEGGAADDGAATDSPASGSPADAGTADTGPTPWVVTTTAHLELVEDAWVTQWSPTLVHPDAAEGSTLRLVREPADRGDILDPSALPIVTARPVYRIGIDKTTVADAAAAATSATELATRLGFEDPAAFAQRVADAGASAFVVAITIRQEEAAQWDVEGLRAIPGVLVQADEVPLAPSSTFARPLLGTVGEATAEIVEESGGAIVAGDQVGLSGLQKVYDAELRGTPGRTVVLATGETEQEMSANPPVRGTDLTITLDTGLQTLAEGILAGVESAAAIVAVQPSTGHVLAAASGPGGNGLNTATVGLFPPGSTFKIATALALLRQGFTPDTPVECSPTITVDGREFQNYPGYPAASLGSIPLREAIAHSCNTALIAQREVVTAADVAGAAAALGIGAAGTWPFPYASGSVPADSTGTGHAASLIGQGEVLASPLAMAVAAASVAHGSTVTPVLVLGHDTQVEAPAAPLTADEAAGLQSLMREVVASGTSTFLQDVPGEPVSAKSGTAQYGTSDPPATNAWMIAFQGDLAVAVFVQVGDYGTATAGPLLEEFLRGAAG